MLNKELFLCRVCGLEQDDTPWGEDGKTASFNICDCCAVSGACRVLQDKSMRKTPVLTLATRMRNSQESKNIVKDGCLKEPLVLAKSEARKLGFRRTVTANYYRFSVNWDSECESAFQCKVFGEELSY